MQTTNPSYFIAKFYDKYTDYQSKVGVNIRHRTIYKNIKREGLMPDSNVLEIGCGIGTLTGLIAKVVTKGKIVSIDISPKSIEIAKSRNRKHSNIEYVVSDMSDFNSIYKYDFVLLADVLEHIPLQDHVSLFEKIVKHIHLKSKILINIPSPYHIEWLRAFDANALQIVDQPLHTNNLLSAIYINNMYLFSLKTYSLFFEQGDYQWLVVKPAENIDEFMRKGKFEMKIQDLKSRLMI